ncbi:hypothetical protein [Stenotrophomonas sp. AB1(2024)]|jgi:hypothetical protein|uniref:hypothetical protein n=1 Tax=Stenotrophomonas sp. AB1(2024) TaxID=3132215 RepID=UPI0030A40A4F
MQLPTSASTLLFLVLVALVLLFATFLVLLIPLLLVLLARLLVLLALLFLRHLAGIALLLIRHECTFHNHLGMRGLAAQVQGRAKAVNRRRNCSELRR